MLKPRAESEQFFKRLKQKVFQFTIIMSICFAVLAFRLWNLQVVQHENLAHRAENNRIRKITLDGLRGKVFDRNGVPLVDNRPSFELALIPEDSPDPKKALHHLTRRMDIDIEAALKQISNARPFASVVLKQDINRAEVAFVEGSRMEAPGIFLQIKPIRNYIHNDLAAHFLGYLGAITPDQFARANKKVYSRNDYLGKSGIEKEFEATLHGEKGSKHIEVDAAGRELKQLDLTPPRSGSDLRVTLDYAAQKAAEQAFEGLMGAAVALDPNTGEILAFISKPSFDPNLFSIGADASVWKALINNEFHPLQNRAIRGQYPPGSTFKLVVAAAALEEKIIDQESTVYCPGHFTLGNRTYRCWKKGGHGRVNVHTAIVQSCDVFFYKTGLQLGINKIAEYAKKFGLGRPSGINLRGEKGGLIPTTAWKKKYRNEPWILGETVSVAIGQGYVLTTPLQLARMAAVFASNGLMAKPKIIHGEPPSAEDPTRIDISEETLTIIRNAMRGVVYEPHGTAWRLKQAKRPYQYAGKTGTSQVIRMKQNEKWDAEKVPFKYRDHALFVSFAPFDNPKIAVGVIAEHAGHGGAVAAPIAQKIIDAYLGSLGKINRTPPATARLTNNEDG